MEKVVVDNLNSHETGILDMVADLFSESCFSAKTCNPIVKVINCTFTNIVS